MISLRLIFQIFKPRWNVKNIAKWLVGHSIFLIVAISERFWPNGGQCMPVSLPSILCVYQQCITVSKRKNCFVDSTCSASQIDETQYIYVLRLCSLWYVLCSLWYVGTGLEGGSPFLVKQYIARRRHTTRKIPRCYYFSLHTIQFNRK